MKSLVKSRITLGAMALVSAFAVSHFAIADEPAAPAPAPKERPARGDGPMGGVLKDLNLTDAQKAQVKDIMAEQKVKRDALKADTTMSEKDKRKAQRDLREETMTKIRAILTPEQQAKLDAALAEQKANRAKKDKPAA